MSALGCRWRRADAEGRQAALVAWLREQYEPATVEQASASLGMTARTVRRHLRVLRSCGLAMPLRDGRRGLWVAA